MPGRKTSVYLSEQLSAAVAASGLPLAELIRRGLAAQEPDPVEATLRRVLAEVLGSPNSRSEDARDSPRAP